jgi:hypothetical protein
MNCVHQGLIRPWSSHGVRLRSGGVEGNERLTGATAIVLVVLLAVEGVSILFLSVLLPVHVLIGMVLIPPVALKVGSTGYRFMRYYQRRREYTVKGPPHALMRFLVAPVLVLSTIGVLGTGLLMVAFGRRDMIVGLHRASFVVWAFAFGIHFLVYLGRLPRLVLPARRIPGGVLRVGVIGTSLIAGIALAAGTFPLARPWLHRGGRERGEDRAANSVRRTARAAGRSSSANRPAPSAVSIGVGRVQEGPRSRPSPCGRPGRRTPALLYTESAEADGVRAVTRRRQPLSDRS